MLKRITMVSSVAMTYRSSWLSVWYCVLKQGKTASLCVRRSLFTDDYGAVAPEKNGICSNFLCDAKPGDDVMLTGPAGKALLLPAKSPDADIILVATGTGVASYR